MTNAISLKIRGQALRLGAMLFTLTALATSTVQAGYVAVSDRPSLPANDLIEWSVLGPAFTAMPNPFVVASTGGTNVTWSQNSGTPERRDQGNGWTGNFPNFGDSLMWTQGLGGGPVTLSFGGSTVSSIGFGIQADEYTPYDGYLELLDASDVVLHTVNFSGISSTDSADYKFVGVYSDNPLTDFAKARFNVTLPGSTAGNFAIDSVSFSSKPVPEPSTWISLGIGSVAIAGYRARRRRANA